MMVHMIKRDYYINFLYVLIIILALPLIYWAQISPLFAYLGVIVGFIFNVFYYDNHNHVSRSIVSMPINKKQIVLGRYTFLFFVSILFLIYIWFIDMLVHYFAPSLSGLLPIIPYKPISITSVLLVFAGIMLLISISIPIFYICQSFIKALIIQGALLFIGPLAFAALGYFLDKIPEAFINGIVDFIELQPILIAITFSVVCLLVSYVISTWIFSRKDII